MTNGQAKEPLIIVPTPKTPEIPVLTCHRYYAPVTFPEPDRIDPRKVNITPRLGNFDCIGTRCMMWDEENKQCFDKTAAQGMALLGKMAFGKINDVHIQDGGA